MTAPFHRNYVLIAGEYSLMGSSMGASRRDQMTSIVVVVLLITKIIV